jgi:serine/threonine protein kinase
VYYQGISSIIQKGEKVKSKRFDYEIIRPLNIGLHNTYLAKNSNGKEVILKQFKNKNKEFIKNQRIIFSFLRNIHQKDKRFSFYLEYIYEQFLYKGYLFEVKAKIDGISFDEYFFSKKHDFKTRFYLARELAKIVMLLHKYGIVHSDLKFEQFMIVKNRLKLIDFNNIIIKDKLYLPAGTPPFRSPEHIRNEVIDEKSDVFTLALMIYNILTYIHPFYELLEKDNFEEQIFNYKVKSLYELNSNFPYFFSKVIQAALSIDKKKRPSAFEIFKSFDYFKMPFLMYDNRKFFIKKFPLQFDKKIASFILPNRFVNFIYTPHFEIYKNNGKIFIKTFKLPFSKDKKFFYPKLNEKSFRNSELKNGDIIRIGKIKIKYFNSLLE